jgi:hypothetical protein
MKGNRTEGNTLKGKKPKQFQSSNFKPKGNFIKKGASFKASQPKGNANGKPKGMCFNCIEMGHYSKDCPKPKLGNGGCKVIALTTNLAQSELNRLIFLKGKVFKREVLCRLDIGASHNFITQKSAKKMEFQLEKLKAPIEVHFADGVPHPATLQARDVPLQLGNLTRKVDLLVSNLRGMECILGMEFITHNNVLIEGHNRLIRIPSKNGIVRVKAHEMPSVGGLTIHLMLGKILGKECMGGYGMLCVMCVLDKFEPKEATNLVTFPKCVKRILDEFPNVMPEELPDGFAPEKTS